MIVKQRHKHISLEAKPLNSLKLRFHIIQNNFRPIRRKERLHTRNRGSKLELFRLNLISVVLLKSPDKQIRKEEKGLEIAFEPRAKVQKTLLVVSRYLWLYEVPKQLHFGFHCASANHQHQACKNEDIDITIFN